MTMRLLTPQTASPFPNTKDYLKKQFGVDFIDSGAGIGTNDLVELTTNQKVRTAVERSALVLGSVRGNVEIDGPGYAENGAVPVKLASAVNALEDIASRANGRAGKALAAQADILGATAGDAFTNQPASDSIQVVSDNAADIGQILTVYASLAATPTVMTKETLVLNGVTPVNSVLATFQEIFGIELSAACAGTITLKELSGGLTVTTIAPAGLSSGIHAATLANSYGLIPRHLASGANTDNVLLVGTDNTGAEQGVIDALAGAVEEDHSTLNFASVDKIMLGAVTGVNVTVKTNQTADTNLVGIALESGIAGDVVGAYINPYYKK